MLLLVPGLLAAPVLADGVPRVLVTSRSEGQGKLGDGSAELGLLLDNPGARTVWFVVGTPNDLMEPSIRPRPSPLQVAGCGEGCWDVDGRRFVRVPARDRRSETFTGQDPLGVGVAEVLADGAPLERSPRLRLAAPCGEPLDCHDAIVHAWDLRIRQIDLTWRERWTVARSGAVADWTPADVQARSVPVETLSAADREALGSLPRAQLVAWLDAAWHPVLASTTARMWQQLGWCFTLDGERRVLRSGCVVAPIDPQGRSSTDEGEFIEWSDAWTWEGAWVAGEAGYTTTVVAGLTRIGGPEAGGMNGPLLPPVTLDSQAWRTGLSVTGAAAPELVETLLTDPVSGCYSDARIGGARRDIDSVAELLTHAPIVFEPGTDLSFDGHVQVVAEVAADGHATRAWVEGPTTERFSACVARNVPMAWWLAPSLDGQLYIVSVTYSLTPDW